MTAMTDEKRVSELLPCPFCGGKAYLRQWSDAARVECTSHGPHSNDCGFTMRTYPSGDQAIAAWNRRSQVPDGWRPIDSAPRHGERVLCGYWHRGNWVTRIAHARGPGEWLSDPGDWQVRPTHWRPLPAAPIPQSNEATKP